MPIRGPSPLLVCLCLVASTGCFEDPAAKNYDSGGNDETTGDGDGDEPTGDGDGDEPTGDGDGDEPTGDGDGDGDEPTGDGDGGPCDSCGPLQLCHDQACVPAAQIIYLNFDAEGDFTYDGNQPADARSNRQSVSADLIGGALPGFNGDSFERQQIVNRVRTDYAELRVIITDERPPEGAYSMIVFTEHPNGHPNVVAIPSTDCGDQNPNDVAFVFFNLASLNHQQRANFVSASAARFAGLESLVPDDSSKFDIMYPFINDLDPSFTDECLPLPDTFSCDFNHNLHCQGKGMQNSWSEIDAAWGF
jgi:hypothetical protein